MTDAEVVQSLKVKVQNERLCTNLVLRELLVVEERQIHLAMGYSSLFVFCQRELGYSGAEAFIRLQGMKLMKALPQVEEHFKSGKLSLTVAAKAQGYFRRTKSSRAKKSQVVSELLGKSCRQAEKQLAIRFPDHKPVEQKVKPLAENRNKIEFVASDEFLAKMEKLKNLLAHKNFEGDLAVLFEQTMDMALKQLEKAPSLRAPQLKPKNSRYIPRRIKYQIWQKAHGQCQYPGCTETHGLQIDHIKPYAHGGLNDPPNLQLLCGSHNRFKSVGKPESTRLAISSNPDER